MGRNSSVGIALCMGLTVWDRIPVDLRFACPVLSGPGAHLSFCTVILDYFLGGKSAGTWLLLSTPK